VTVPADVPVAEPVLAPAGSTPKLQAARILWRAKKDFKRNKC
jgi:hypothetical protein